MSSCFISDLHLDNKRKDVKKSFFNFLESEASEFDKIIHLTHEVGHVIYRMDPLFRSTKDTMFCESLAWYLGYHFMAEHGYVIEMKEYEAEIKHALKLYRWSENDRDVK